MTLETVQAWLRSNFGFFLIAILVINLYQRRYGEKGLTKRMATLLISFLFLGFYAFIIFLKRMELSVHLMWLYLGAALFLMIWKRRSFFPFRRKCPVCQKGVNWETMFFLDHNTHEECLPKDESEAAPRAELEEPEETKSDSEN